MFKAMMIDYHKNTLNFWEYSLKRFNSKEDVFDYFSRRKFIKDNKGNCDLISYDENKRDLGIKIVKVM